ncbi:hypothetical protein POSPLADRAFT_1045693 [Postia placenta MAD-698-R-SB12]|uniref:Retrovirus-related Pol polyprotein from transposon TNT 1-94-like beta-barrel domain-containing protein n=1 Tax=Postia placenta MAD-698-R-SB12 TaxID=670580 RepID=A0A1X6N4E2_9APHY|nr:hypothetical protein POSPLADRAFT_1045693 [Postia placenta MAD-698-R-SB12]OSX63346.1 hypothetical protein POSPLADRAFT_1045693 [Postia placenta MAD-698-R-SB12]
MTRLELEWQVTTGSIIGSNLGATSSATALVAKTHGHSGKPRKTCSNCSLTGHDVLAAKRARRDKDRGKAPAGSKVLRDAAGHAFMVSDAGEIHYVDTSITAASTATPTTEFAGLAVDTPAPDDLWASAPLSPADAFEYSALTGSLVDEDTASIDWAADPAAFSASSNPAAALGAAPFFFDSGASAHLSPCKEDFSDLVPIAPRGIRGVNGSVIYARGVGRLRDGWDWFTRT